MAQIEFNYSGNSVFIRNGGKWYLYCIATSKGAAITIAKALNKFAAEYENVLSVESQFIEQDLCPEKLP